MTTRTDAEDGPIKTLSSIHSGLCWKNILKPCGKSYFDSPQLKLGIQQDAICSSSAMSFKSKLSANFSLAKSTLNRYTMRELNSYSLRNMRDVHTPCAGYSWFPARRLATKKSRKSGMTSNRPSFAMLGTVGTPSSGPYFNE